MTRLIHWLATRLVWGPRCPEHMDGCPCCDHWAEHDWLFGGDE